MRSFLERLVPKNLGTQCIVAGVLGVSAAVVLGSRTAVLAPLGQTFIRSSQIVTMPYMLLEVMLAIGSLSRRTLRDLLRVGVVAFGLLMVAALALILMVSSWFPKSASSPFFSRALLEPEKTKSFIETILPYNVFTAMADDNFPAVVLFTAVLAGIVQGLPGRALVLAPVAELRAALVRMNKLVGKITPLGVFALAAQAVGKMDGDALVRMQVLPIVAVGGAIPALGLLLVVLGSVEGLGFRDLFRALRAPFVLAASSGNLLITLPMLSTAIEELLAERWGIANDVDDREELSEQVGATVPVAYVLPTFGQAYMMLVLPFMAWYVDRPLRVRDTIAMFGTAVPALVGGLRAAVREGLKGAALEEDLIGIVVMHADWMYRLEKAISFLGIVVVSVAIAGHARGKLRFRAPRLLGGLALVGLLATGIGVGVKALLARNLAGSYRNDERLLKRQPLVKASRAVTAVAREEMKTRAPAGFPRLDDIRARGVLRVGVRESGFPFAFERADGTFAGYDLDLLSELAESLAVDLVITKGNHRELHEMLAAGEIDVALGGMHDSARRPDHVHATRPYQTVHRALLVWDDNIEAVQSAERHPEHERLVVAVSGQDIPSTDVRAQMEARLGAPGPAVPIDFEFLETRAPFFDEAERSKFDALLTTAEVGSAWAVLNPKTTMLAVFGSDLPEDIVIVYGGEDRAFEDFLDRWVRKHRDRGLFERLFKHWIEVQ
jgi:Na+/H+-dicarboxylate symporter/ABC-type amino acid transport substrate-binding protein